MNLRHWLRQTAHVASLAGVDDYGTPGYGAQRSVLVRHEQGVRRVVGVDGEEVLSDSRLFVDEELQLTDRIWPPGADTSSADAARRPLRIEAVPDHAGAVPFWVVYL